MLGEFVLSDSFLWVLVVVFAAIVGSFLNLAIYRLPKMMEASFLESIDIFYKYRKAKKSNNLDRLEIRPAARQLSLFFPGSFCPLCKVPILWRHKIPLLSFFFLKGGCANCRAPISWSYPIVEFLAIVTALISFSKSGLSLNFFALITFSWILIVLSFIDLENQILPDEVTYFLLWSGLFFSLFPVFISTKEAVIGALAGYFFFYFIATIFHLITKRIGLGEGDYKLLAALGSFVGWKSLSLVVAGASLFGLLYFLIIYFFKGSRVSKIPFAPFLSLAGLIVLFNGAAVSKFFYG